MAWHAEPLTSRTAHAQHCPSILHAIQGLLGRLLEVGEALGSPNLPAAVDRHLAAELMQVWGWESHVMHAYAGRMGHAGLLLLTTPWFMCQWRHVGSADQHACPALLYNVCRGGSWT